MLYEREEDGAGRSQSDQIAQRPFTMTHTFKKNMDILLEGVNRQMRF